MQNWGKAKVQCLVRNTHSGIYYARARVNGKLLWKTLETDSLTVAKARLPKVLAELGRGSARRVPTHPADAQRPRLVRSRRCIPHGGHQMSLNIAADLIVR